MRTFSITDVGMVRQVNQDYVYVTDRPLGILQNLFVVADGMGGHQAGDYASKYTVEVLNRELALSEGEDIERCLVGAIKTANREIIKEASRDEHLKGMGTTVVAATISNQMMYFANVGDSRLYLINQGIQQLTKDHSLVEEMVRLGGIKPEEAKHHPDKNIITRAIGAKADVEVDFYEHRLKRGDIILMCTDGLSNMVEDEELFHIVQGGRDIVESGHMWGATLVARLLIAFVFPFKNPRKAMVGMSVLCTIFSLFPCGFYSSGRTQSHYLQQPEILIYCSLSCGFRYSQ